MFRVDQDSKVGKLAHFWLYIPWPKAVKLFPIFLAMQCKLGTISVSIFPVELKREARKIK